jgi:hypothetical protein
MLLVWPDFKRYITKIRGIKEWRIREAVILDNKESGIGFRMATPMVAQSAG